MPGETEPTTAETEEAKNKTQAQVRHEGFIEHACAARKMVMAALKEIDTVLGVPAEELAVETPTTKHIPAAETNDILGRLDFLIAS